jgi:pyruvate dehydrogenase E2 component (dihydrolipoamide acetyltransferase)
MPYEVKLPDIGEGVAEGEIVRWLVKAGDAVTEDQPLVEVMTDKASVEIPSPRHGVVAGLHAEEGQVVPVGTVIVTIEVAGESERVAPRAESAGASMAQAVATSVPKSAPPVAPARGAAPQATPAVRQLARQLGVALDAIAGSGPDGRITAEDVQRAAAGAGSPTGTPPAAAAPSADGEERIPLRGLRRRIAEHMRHSLQTAAHFTFVAECDMTAIAEHRATLKARAAQANVRLTYLAYVLKALVEPLQRFPLLNASLDDAAQEIVLKRSIHVGVATATDEGLMVPVIHHVPDRTLLGLAGEIERLARGARAGSLRLDELQGGTFTVTSTGARGGLLATPILHHPQVGILGVHEVKKKPAVVNDRIVAREMTNLSLSLDHRVVDGAVGADFLYALIARLQEPASWLTEDQLG